MVSTPTVQFDFQPKFPDFFSLNAYHLARKSGNFCLKSNGKVISRKFRSEIVAYLQRYPSFSVRNGTSEISLPFAKLSNFQSLISRKQLLLILEKPFLLFNARPNRFILTNGKHPVWSFLSISLPRYCYQSCCLNRHLPGLILNRRDFRSMSIVQSSSQKSAEVVNIVCVDNSG